MGKFYNSAELDCITELAEMPYEHSRFAAPVWERVRRDALNLRRSDVRAAQRSRLTTLQDTIPPEDAFQSPSREQWSKLHQWVDNYRLFYVRAFTPGSPAEHLDQFMINLDRETPDFECLEQMLLKLEAIVSQHVPQGNSYQIQIAHLRGFLNPKADTADEYALRDRIRRLALVIRDAVDFESFDTGATAWSSRFDFVNMPNTPFTASEQQSVIAAINSLEANLIMRLEGAEDRLMQITETIGLLREDLDKIGRKDWYTLLMSTIMQMLVSDFIPPGTLRSAFLDAWGFLASVYSAVKYLGS